METYSVTFPLKDNAIFEPGTEVEGGSDRRYQIIGVTNYKDRTLVLTWKLPA